LDDVDLVEDPAGVRWVFYEKASSASGRGRTAAGGPLLGERLVETIEEGLRNSDEASRRHSPERGCSWSALT
jgi:hypothetical protein